MSPKVTASGEKVELRGSFFAGEAHATA